MKNLLIPNSFQTFVMEVKESMNKGLNLIRRLTVEKASRSNKVKKELRYQKSLKVMYRFDYTGNFITLIESIGNEMYRVYFSKTEYRDVNGTEMISVFDRVKDVAVAQKAKDTVEKTDYAIAKIRLTKLGNHSYMKKNGRFSAGYSERQTFKTLKGAENTLARLVKAKKVSLNSVKIVSTELSN